MKTFSTKHPLLFGAILFLVSLLVAGVLVAVSTSAGLSADAGTVLGRIVVAIILIVLFRECFHWDRSFSCLALALPVLLIVAWNIVYHLVSGSEFVSTSGIPGAILSGLAPGLFEEVIFRGIVIDRLRASGKDDNNALWESAILFALLHLTNAVGMDLASLLVQVGYSTVIGLLFGAIYLKGNDIATVILAHTAIDFSNYIFATQPASSSIPMVIGFVVVIAVEAAYAMWLFYRSGK